MHKAPYVFPIIGGRKVEHLLQNLEALEISLTDEHIKELENVVPFQHGFPAWMIVSSHPEIFDRLGLIV
jgi:aryl-alcohol dehydrogenase-like predicted oxidoreductase